jgi:Right handed beta helix region
MTIKRALPWVVVAAAASLAFLDSRLSRGTTLAPADGPPILVTDGSDFGPGSLREALLRAAGYPGRAEVVISAEKLTVRSPLPPMTNPRGMILRSASIGSCSLDASALTGGAVLDVRAPSSRIEGIRIVGAPDAAVLVRAPNVSLQALQLERNHIGVRVAEASSGVVISDSLFADNASGVRIEGAIERLTLRYNVFRNHSVAGLWAVSPSQAPGYAGDALVVVGNRFEGNRIAAVVIYLPAVLEANDVFRSVDTGLYLGGSRNAVLENRFLGAGANGLLAYDVSSTLVRHNEVGNNRSIGLLFHGGGSNRIQDNRVYGNGFGIALVQEAASQPTLLDHNVIFAQKYDGVWTFAGQPILRDNRVVDNHGVGLRIVEKEGQRSTADDAADERLVRANHFEQNAAALTRERQKAYPE